MACGLNLLTSTASYAQLVRAVSAAVKGPAGPRAASGSSGAAVFSGDGRLAFFLSTASDLVPNLPATGSASVYSRDLTTGLVRLVSPSAAHGGPGNGDVTGFDVSANGHWVAFSSRSSDMVPGDTNQVEDVFLFDVEAGKTIRITEGADGGQADRESGYPSISADGRFVIFESLASNLVSGLDQNGVSDVFLWNRETRGVTLVSATTNGISGNGRSIALGMSEDGSRTMFRSEASNLVPDADGIPTDLFIWTRVSNSVSRISLPGLDAQGAQSPVTAYNPVLSGDGRLLAFRTRSSPGGSAGHEGVWLVDLEQGTRTNVSAGLWLRQPVGLSDSSGPVMTRDGSRLAFEAQDTTNRPGKVWLWSKGVGLKLLGGQGADPTANGIEPGGSFSPVLSPDGQFLAFQSTNAVPLAGVPTSGKARWYVHEIGTEILRTPFPSLDDETACAFPMFSSDGTKLLLESAASIPGAEDSNGESDVFAMSLALDNIQMLSQADPSLARTTGRGATLGLGDDHPGILSHDGRLVTFSSDAEDLVPIDGNGLRDVFVRDLVEASTEMISVAPDGRPSNGDSGQPTMTPDGRHVAFVSSGSNMLAGDMGWYNVVFVRDRASGLTRIASALDRSDVRVNGLSGLPRISATGHLVSFSRSDYSALSPTSAREVLVRHVASQRSFKAGVGAGSNIRLAVMDSRGEKIFYTPSLLDGKLHSYKVGQGGDSVVISWPQPVPSADVFSLSQSGSRIAFAGINPASSTSGYGVYWREIGASNSAGEILRPFGPWAQRARNISISADGRRVVFQSVAAPSGMVDMNGTNDVFVYDIATKALSRVSTSYEGNRAARGTSDSPVISGDGRLVAFRSDADDLVPGDTNGCPDIFVCNLDTGRMEMVSRRWRDGAPANGRSFTPMLSADGRTCLFRSTATDLVPGDYNGLTDLFAATLPPSWVGGTGFNPPFVMTTKDPPIPLPPVSWAGLPVRYEVVSGPGLIVDGRLIPQGVGSLVVRATEQKSDGSAGESTTRSISVMVPVKEPQAIRWGITNDMVIQGVSEVPLRATSSSGLPVRFVVLSGPATVEGERLLVTGYGRVVVMAGAPASDGFLADEVTRTFSVQPAPVRPTLSISVVLGGQGLDVGVTGASGGTAVIERSPDLVLWTPILTNALPLRFEVPSGPGLQGYYRAYTPGP